MSDRIRPPRRLAAAYAGPARGLAVYLAGSMHGTDRNRPAFAQAEADLLAAGFEVSTPTEYAGDDLDALTASVADDLDALAEASLVVTLPGAEDVFETVTAATLGVPVITLAATLAVAAFYPSSADEVVTLLGMWAGAA